METLLTIDGRDKVFVLWFFLIFSLIVAVESNQQGFLSVDCGATKASTDPETGLDWVSDNAFIKTGTQTILKGFSGTSLLGNLRFFPQQPATKYCYVLPALRNRRYLVRTTYFYGDYDGKRSPPVFDQIIDGTVWATVNTSLDYSNNVPTYYEMITETGGKSVSVCLGRNAQTVGDPFISAIELRLLEPSMYNATDFNNYALTYVARHNFGYSGNIIRYPDDPYDRFWHPFQDSHQSVTGNISVNGLWNIPPNKVMETALATEKLESMEIQWPNGSIVNSKYYIALYIANLVNRSQSPPPRIFNITVNGFSFWTNMNATWDPWLIYGNNWILSGITKLLLTPVNDSRVGPIINAGEMFQMLPLGGRTVTRDIIALDELKKNLTNVPLDWEGDPCLPVGYSWTGITCSQGPQPRVTMLNLTNAGLGGSLSASIVKLTALSHILLGNNNLTGPIPDMANLKLLSSLHLDHNKINGSLPESLTQLQNLSELFVQGNQLSGQVPKGLSDKPGLNLRIYPGNPLLVYPSAAPAPAPAPGSLQVAGLN